MLARDITRSTDLEPVPLDTSFAQERPVTDLRPERRWSRRSRFLFLIAAAAFCWLVVIAVIYGLVSLF